MSRAAVCARVGETCSWIAASWTRAWSQSCGISASAGTCCSSLRIGTQSASSPPISDSSSGSKRPQPDSASTSRRRELTWCCNAPTHQRSSLKLTSPCSWANAFTMSSISETRRSSESKITIHDESFSPGVTFSNCRQAAISSCNCLTVTTSVRCLTAPRLAASVVMASMVSASPAIAPASKRAFSGNSTHACLTANK